MLQLTLKLNLLFVGFGDMQNRFVPEWVKLFSPAKNWKVIAGGQHHTLAIDKDGKSKQKIKKNN